MPPGIGVPVFQYVPGLLSNFPREQSLLSCPRARVEDTGTLEHIYKANDLNGNTNWNTASRLEHLSIAPLAGPARTNIGPLPAGHYETACHSVCRSLVLPRGFNAETIKDFRDRNRTPALGIGIRTSLGLFVRVRGHFLLPNVRDISPMLFLHRLLNYFSVFQPPFDASAVLRQGLGPEQVTISLHCTQVDLPTLDRPE